MIPRYFLAFLLLAPAALPAAEPRPNILWIVSEDNSAWWLGCYGNKEAQTPRLDALSAQSLQFTHACSNAPVCAVARATLLMGAYSPTMGTQHMRSRHAIPASFKPYVTYLREAGYYCSNNAKTDYNFKGNDASLWDESSGKAHYRKRPDGKPFFSIFNLTVSHESSLFPDKVAANRRNGTIPQKTRLDPLTISLPACVPDLPEVRSDFAIYHDNMTALDSQVGRILDELESAGLTEDTIVFYYGDHGGPTPRGKRYLKDSGTRIPLLIRVPQKWKSMTGFAVPSMVDEQVGFVDFAPTLLSLLGQEKPAQMQGRAFLGPKRQAPPEKPVTWLFADRFDEIYGMRRGITDGRYRYIRRFSPHLPAAPCSYYQLTMPSWAAWQKAWQDGKLSGYYKAIWEAPQAADELFDTESDPWEVKNLAADPAHAERLAAMQRRMREMMEQTRDTSLVPEPLWADVCQGGTIHDYVRSPAFDLPATLDLAFRASSGEVADLPALTAALGSKDPVHRYWGALGCVVLGPEADSARAALETALTDPLSAIRTTAAHALFAAGRKDEALAALIAELDRATEEYAGQLLVNTFTAIHALEQIPDSWVDKTLADRNAGDYVLRLAKRLKKKLKPGDPDPE